MQALSLENLPSGLDGVAHRFAAILDPRKARGKRHPLSAIFTVCICATLCGAKSFDAMEQWARAQSREVLKKLGCRYGRPPSERTIRRMLQKTGVSLDDATTQWQAEFLSLKGEAVALDGKTLRGSHKGGENRKHLLSAVDHRGARILAQVEVGEKTNEIPCAIPLLNKIAIEGAVITGDAMHTQRELARYLVDDRKADYVFTVKDNQPKLKEDIARLDWAAIPPSASN